MSSNAKPEIPSAVFHGTFLVGELHFAIFSYANEFRSPYRAARMDSNFGKYTYYYKMGSILNWRECLYFFFRAGNPRFDSVKDIQLAALRGELELQNEGEVTWT